MSLKEDHIDGCGCPSCHDMQNIDGYASGMELVPDPNQHLSPDLINDPNFIASIVQQVLQQMNLQEDGVEEQLDLLYHDMTNDKGDKTGEWYKAVNKVKTDIPKPE